MAITDSVSDMLTRIRNASRTKKEKVDVPASKMKSEIAKILKAEGYISNFKLIEDRKQGILRVYLRYTPDKKTVITGIKRVSRPSRRIYKSAQELPKVLGGLGMAIVSTSHGMMTDKDARKTRFGGEIICYIW